MAYEDFVRRNVPYVAPVTQARLRQTRVLIAGCGIGSFAAEALARLGCETFVLIDPDVVELSNLNRQCFREADVGHLKVEALAARLRSVRESICVTALPVAIGPENAAACVAQADLVIDSVDLVSAAAVVALHDAVRAAHKPAITLLNIGFGAGAMVFPAHHPVSFREAFGLPAQGSLVGTSYLSFFVPILGRLAPYMDPRVSQALAPVLQLMAEGKPCPAPQVATGVFAVAHLCAHLTTCLLAHEAVPVAPEFILYDPVKAIAASAISLGQTQAIAVA